MKISLYGQSGKMIAVKLILIGALAGLVNGLLGAGGGIITVFGIGKILGETLKEKNDIFATALCVMLPVSAVSCIIYAAKGHIRTEGFGVFVIPAIVGGAVGGFLLGRLDSLAVKKIFAVLVVISGILLIIR